MTRRQYHVNNDKNPYKKTSTAHGPVISRFSTMKSNRLVLTLCAFVIFVAVAVHPAGSTFFRGTTRAVQRPGHRRDPMMTMYKAIYCRNKQCPNWRCQDDSAMIHGYCCGCRNLFGVEVRVLCVDDLKCPLKTKDLCDDYHFMTTCCCS